jgi:uncharacterized repeat protein (TIGR03803 family)
MTPILAIQYLDSSIALSSETRQSMLGEERIAGSLHGCRRIYALLLFCAAGAIVLPAQTFTSLSSFNGADGNHPVNTPIEGFDGNLYGTAQGGGHNNKGTVFKVTPTGTLTAIYLFCVQVGCPDGTQPSGLIRATDGNFYGTTTFGGANKGGTVFRITPGGTLSTLYSFCTETNELHRWPVP